MKVRVTETPRAGKLLKASATLAKLSVGVGIPAENEGRSGGMTNSALLTLLEHGSAVNRMPPRPVLRPPLEQPETRQAMAAALARACAAAAEGNAEGVRAGFEEAGAAGAAAVKAYMTSGAAAPNAPFTLTGGWARNRVSGKPFHADPKAGSTPLVNTGQLMNAIGYKVEEKP